MSALSVLGSGLWMIFMKLLKQIKISRKVYVDIVSKWHNIIKWVDQKDNLYEHWKQDKRYIYAKEEKAIVVSWALLPQVLDDGGKSVICVVNQDQVEDIISDFTPLYCKQLVSKQLHKKGLKDNAIEDRLNQFQVEEDKKLKQQHKIEATENVITKWENCYYYDINKAHMDALIEIFPELKDWFINVAKKSKTDKRFKSIANYYVGLLGKEDGKFRKTYNWIVDRTSRILLKLVSELSVFSSEVIYANTDGFVISNPIATPASSSEIGKFKLETDEHTFYTYRHKSGNCKYFVMQYGDTIKGNLPLALRDKIDLRKSIVVDYVRHKEDGYYVYDNVKSYVLEDKLNG